MGNQNNSVARKRLSTLAITTTLAAVGVGVIGTGAANAATGTPLAQTQDGTTTVATAAAVKVAPGTGSTSLTATADLTGSVVDPTAVGTATVTIDWNDGKGPQPVTLDSTGVVKGTLTHTYAAAGTYNVVVSVDDGLKAANSVKTATASVTVTDATLAATLSAKTAAKNSPVTLSLTGSSVDKSITAAETTVDWGDKTAVVTFDGDPAAIKPTDARLSHSYTADGTYTVKVSLNDGLGTKTSVTTQTFTVTVGATGVVVDRASGNDRYGTGLAISQHQWASTGVTTDTREKAKAVVLATGNDFADALVAVPFAKKAQGPLLLTDGLAKTTNPAVLAEIKRILPTAGTNIYIAGGEKAVSSDIESQLKGLGYTVTRLSGPDRFATALQIAKVGMADPSHIIVARGDEGDNGNGFADALSAGPYAADVWGGGNSAIVLSNFKTFDANTAAYVTSKLHPGSEKYVAAIGGQAAAAMETIKGSTGLYSSAVGATRYETAQQVAQAFEPTAKNAPIGIATGTLFPDALTGGAEMATVGGPLLLTDPATLSAATKAELSDVAATAPSVTIFGGEKAITPAVANAIAALVKVTTIGKF